jgi:hypothetical protein
MHAACVLGARVTSLSGSTLQKSAGVRQQDEEYVEMAVRQCAEAEITFARSLSRHLRSLYEPKTGFGPLSDLVEQLCEALDRMNAGKR